MQGYFSFLENISAGLHFRLYISPPGMAFHEAGGKPLGEAGRSWAVRNTDKESPSAAQTQKFFSPGEGKKN
jgi:hypothetical protein